MSLPDGGHNRLAPLVALAGVSLAVLAVRLVAAGRAETFAPDGAVYLTMARQLARHGPAEVARSYAYPPGYPATVAALAAAAGAAWPDGWAAVGRGVSIVMSVIALAAVCAIARSLYGTGPALATTLLLGLGRAFVRTGSDVLSDAQALACATTAVALALAARRRLQAGRAGAVALAAAGGLLAGLGYLTRPEALLAGPIGLALLLALRGLRPRERRRQVAAALVAAGLMLACVLPYALTVGGLTRKKSAADFLSRAPRRGPASAGGFSLAATGTQPSALATGSPRRKAGVVGVRPLAPAGAALLAALRVLADRGRSALGNPATVLVLLAFATWIGQAVLRLPLPPEVRLRTPRAEGTIVLAAGPLCLLPILVALELRAGPGYLSSRHLLLPAFLVAPLAGAGLRVAVAWTLRAAGRLGLRRMPALAWALWVAALAALGLARAFPRPHADAAGLRSAAERIREQLGPGRYILARDARVPLFAGAPPEQFQDPSRAGYELHRPTAENPTKLLRRLRGTGGRHAYDLVVLRPAEAAWVRRLVARLRRDGRFEELPLGGGPLVVFRPRGRVATVVGVPGLY